jgi:hypothetical protein
MQKLESVSPELYLPLRHALRLLPNIRQALAREQLGRALLQPGVRNNVPLV